MWPWKKSHEDKMNPTDNSYKVFTTEFDQVVLGNDLSENLSPEEREQWEQQVDAYDVFASVERTKANLKAMECIEQIKVDNPQIGPDTAVTILLDHSGSLKGQRAILSCLITEVIADLLSRLNVNYEILGFTTVKWKGGNARQKWQSMGYPPNPGRLNDLLHIVYKEASDTSPGSPYSVKNILRSDLVKENIDGEAIEWARGRLDALDCKKRLIVVVSDGAPVDDSTLHENNPNILFDHLKLVIKETSDMRNTQLAGIGIDLSLDDLYEQALQIDGPSDVVAKLPQFLKSLLETPSAKTP